eukprot:TRINITY_DN2784_c0_g1_i1.p1 TRINITY_DN2784_c0_g1~~TRINITY_DN2784_c0_g1_i1.p1  ORF type:complete len:246 (+),score=25.08 TRINITY_DN2784_c0_g1_i1:69-740(+)
MEFPLYVQLEGGEKIPIDVPVSGTVQSIRDAVRHLGAGTCIRYQGQEMHPEVTLADAGIGPEAVVQLESTRRVRWLPDRTHEKYELRDDNRTVYTVGGGSGVALGEELGPGVTTWEVKLGGDEVYDIQIGVAKSSIAQSAYLDSVPEGQSIRSSGTMFGSSGHGSCPKFGRGDVIKLTFNRETSVLTFALNGETMNCSYSDVPPHVRPAVTMPREGDFVTLMC